MGYGDAKQFAYNRTKDHLSLESSQELLVKWSYGSGNATQKGLGPVTYGVT